MTLAAGVVSGLSPVYSRHNGYGLWGPPPNSATTVVLAGWFDQADVTQWFVTCRTAAQIDNGVELDNDEQGAPVRVCSTPTRPWRQIWPLIIHLE